MAKSKQNDTESKDNTQEDSATGTSAGTQASQGQASQGKPHGTQQADAGAPGSAVELLKQDHRKVESLFEEFAAADDGERQELLAHQICRELKVHAMIEEEIFYRACRSAASDDEDTSDKLDEAQVEHDSAKILINEILHGHPDDPFWKAKVCVLRDQIQHHVEEEEMPNDGVMAKAQEEGIDTPDLAKRLKRRKAELMNRHDDRRPARTVSLEPSMPGVRGGGWSRFEDAERAGYRDRGQDRRFGGYASGGRDEQYRREAWDEHARYRGDDERPGRREDDDRRHSGWYGDSRGHTEAARRGWEERRDHGEDDRRSYGFRR
ncbi:MAG: hemerythrin domain-containing protein [Reyranellaceae bacterium]